MIEDAGLVGTEYLPGFGIANVARVAGVEDPRVELHELSCRFTDEHVRSLL